MILPLKMSLVLNLFSSHKGREHIIVLIYLTHRIQYHYNRIKSFGPLPATSPICGLAISIFHLVDQRWSREGLAITVQLTSIITYIH